MRKHVTKHCISRMTLSYVQETHSIFRRRMHVHTPSTHACISSIFLISAGLPSNVKKKLLFAVWSAERWTFQENELIQTRIVTYGTQRKKPRSR